MEAGKEVIVMQLCSIAFVLTLSLQALKLDGLHGDWIFNTSFSQNGALMATSAKVPVCPPMLSLCPPMLSLCLPFSRADSSHAIHVLQDSMVRVLDPRASGSSSIVNEFQAHAGKKWTRVQFISPDGLDLLFTVGCGSMSQRELKLWDARTGKAPLQSTQIDSSGGVLFPLYDEGTHTVFLSGKGDTGMRMYELHGGVATKSSPKAHYDMNYMANEPACGATLLPKRSCNVQAVEFSRILRLTTSTAHFVSYTAPRVDKLKAYFQDDLFPPAPTGEPALTHAEWLAGGNKLPVCASLCPDGMTPLSQKPAEAPVVSSAAKIRAKLDAEAEEANQKDAQFSRMQKLAVQRSQFHVNKSMGSKGNADQPHKAWTGKETTRYVSENDDSSDGGWSDDD
jgi:hypothetical protein